MAGAATCERREGLAPPSADWRGFRVESDGGRIGFVALVRRDLRSGEPAQIVVRAGKIGKSVLLIAAEDVDVVVPEGRWLALRRGWRLLATGASSAAPRP